MSEETSVSELRDEVKRLARDMAATHLRETLAEATGRMTLANSEEAEKEMDAAIDSLVSLVESGLGEPDAS